MLTKPDLIGPGNEEEVMQTLRNVRKPLKLGYVMVKNRSQAQVRRRPRVRGMGRDGRRGATDDGRGRIDGGGGARVCICVCVEWRLASAVVVARSSPPRGARASLVLMW